MKVIHVYVYMFLKHSIESCVCKGLCYSYMYVYIHVPAILCPTPHDVARFDVSMDKVMSS